MSKPEDIRIPADVDAETWRAAASAMASVGWYGTSMIRGAYIAIMAAKAEEREEIAAFCAKQAPLVVGEAFASAIRKRGESHNA